MLQIDGLGCFGILGPRSSKRKAFLFWGKIPLFIPNNQRKPTIAFETTPKWLQDERVAELFSDIFKRDYSALLTPQLSKSTRKKKNGMEGVFQIEKNVRPYMFFSNRIHVQNPNCLKHVSPFWFQDTSAHL